MAEKVDKKIKYSYILITGINQKRNNFIGVIIVNAILTVMFSIIAGIFSHMFLGVDGIEPIVIVFVIMLWCVVGGLLLGIIISICKAERGRRLYNKSEIYKVNVTKIDSKFYTNIRLHNDNDSRFSIKIAIKYEQDFDLSLPSEITTPLIYESFEGHSIKEMGKMLVAYERESKTLLYFEYRKMKSIMKELNVNA